MKRKIHTFDNGVKVYDDQLIPQQRARYRAHNVHEATEEGIFLELIDNMPPDAIYLDIGAAIGYYPLLAKLQSPGLRIHAAEPLARHRSYLQENILLNGFSSADFTIHDQAVAASEGMVGFIDDGFGSSIASNALSSPSLKLVIKSLLGRMRPATLQKIEAITLDRLVETIGEPIDLVQIDVQGFELDVLRGAVASLEKGDLQKFLIGTHGARVHQACARLLQQYGYHIEVDQVQAQGQPDGILVASKTGWRPGGHAWA